MKNPEFSCHMRIDWLSMESDFTHVYPDLTLIVPWQTVSPLASSVAYKACEFSIWDNRSYSPLVWLSNLSFRRPAVFICIP